MFNEWMEKNVVEKKGTIRRDYHGFERIVKLNQIFKDAYKV